MTIERWIPFREMAGLEYAVNSLLAQGPVQPSAVRAERGAATFTLPLDVTEAEGDFVVRASLPGMKPEDVQATVLGDTVTIRGQSRDEEENGHHWLLRERRSGSFQRSVSMGMPIDADMASARFEDGILTLTLPKSEQARPKPIKFGDV
jgi:HSP20 family protein